MKRPQARLTPGFLAHVEATGLTDKGAAGAIGVTEQVYVAVKAGKEAPTVGFLAGAVNAGLADSFAGVAEPVALAGREGRSHD